MSDGKVVFDITGNLSGINSALNSATNTIAQQTAKWTVLGNAAMNALTSTAKIAFNAVKDFAKNAFEYNAQMQTYEVNFKTMLGSAEAAQVKMAELKQYAAKTPFAFGDLADATQTMLAFGMTSEESALALRHLGDISLGDANKLKSLTLAFSQVSSAGKLAGQDLLQMINAGFNPLNVIAEKTGVAYADLKAVMSGEKTSEDFQLRMEAARREVEELGTSASEGAIMLAQIGKDGMISADMVAAAMRIATSEGGAFYKALENASETAKGQISTIKDSWDMLAGKVTGGVFDQLSTSVLPKTIEWLDELNAAFDEGGFTGLKTAAGRVFGEIGGMAKEAGTDLLANILAGLTGDTDNSEKIKATLGDIFSAAGKAKDDVVNACKTFFSDVAAALGDPDATHTEKIGGVFTAAKGAMGDVLGAAGTFMMDLYVSISGDAEGAAKVTQYVCEVWNGAKAGLDNIIAVGGGLLSGIYKGLTEDGETRQNIIQFFTDMFGEIKDGAGEFGQMLKTVYTELTGKEATPENIAQTAEDVGERAGQAAKGAGQVLTGEAKAVLRVPALINDLIEADNDKSLTTDEKEQAKVMALAELVAEPAGDILGGVGEIVGAVAGWDSIQEFEDAAGLEHFGPGRHKTDHGYTEDPGILAQHQALQESTATVLASQQDLIKMIGTMWNETSTLGLTESTLDTWLSVIQKGSSADGQLYVEYARAVMDAWEMRQGQINQTDKDADLNLSPSLAEDTEDAIQAELDGMNFSTPVDAYLVLNTSELDAGFIGPQLPPGWTGLGHATGGLFNAATRFLGADGIHTFGESGAEALLPLDTLWRKMGLTFDQAFAANLDALQYSVMPQIPVASPSASIDEDKLAETIAAAVREAVSGLSFEMDKRKVGKIVAKEVSHEIANDVNGRKWTA